MAEIAVNSLINAKKTLHCMPSSKRKGFEANSEDMEDFFCFCCRFRDSRVRRVRVLDLLVEILAAG